MTINEDNPERQVNSIIGLLEVCMIADLCSILAPKLRITFSSFLKVGSFFFSL